MRNHGTDPDTRYELVEARVLAMREIWAADEATFHGRLVNFDRIWSWPTPVQNPMPVFVGGNSPGAEERAVRPGTGWAPIHLPGTLERVSELVRTAAVAVHGESVTVVGEDASSQMLERYASIYALAICAEEGELQREIEKVLAVQAELTSAA